MKYAIVTCCVTALAWGQVASISISPKPSIPNAAVRIGPVHDGLYVIRFASMLDLIHIAYGVDERRIFDGPQWLEMTHFDVAARVPANPKPEELQAMLQSLLRDRFKLVVQRESWPMPAYALVSTKRPQLKKRDGSEASDCKPETGSTNRYHCRNISMDEFAQQLSVMAGYALGFIPVVNETGLEGRWSFDITYALPYLGQTAETRAEQTTIFQALHSQLGLDLEMRQIATSVVVVKSVNKEPTENVLAMPSGPTKFDVASVKPSADGSQGYRILPGGRVVIHAAPMRVLISRAFGLISNDQFAGLPNWVDAEPFDIEAKAPETGEPLSLDSLSPMLRSLLVERFHMTWHEEQRPITAYSLLSVKPRMKKADPSRRTSCDTGIAPPGAAPGSLVMTCRNISMAEFADQLQYRTSALILPVLDATGLSGRWDISLTFNPIDEPSASDPTGAISIFDAVANQLGLKLEKQKRLFPVIVIDHIDRVPAADN